jgi:PatG C-terminal
LPAASARDAIGGRVERAVNEMLTAVEVRPSRLSGARRILDVISTFTNRQSDLTSKYLVRVDVTEKLLFPKTKLSPYFDN